MKLPKILLGLIISILFGSCSNSPDESKSNYANSKYGGVFSTNQFQSFSTLFPPKAFENSSAQIGQHVYETLVKYEGRNSVLTPGLAESWTVNDDATVYTFNIRKGVWFPDNECFKNGKGRQLTAEDVQYCLLRLCIDDPSNKNSWLLLDQIKGAQAFFDDPTRSISEGFEGISADKNTVRITLNKPNVEFIHVLAHFGTSIYPKEMFEYFAASGELDYTMVGTGPFKAKLIRPQDVVILERNELYWKKSEEGDELPYLDGIKVSFEENSALVEKAMQNGAIHAVINADMQEGGGSFNNVVKLKSSDYVSSGDLDFEVIYCGFLNSEAPFNDPLVRKAFSYAIDRKVIADLTLSGSAYPGIYGIVPPAFKNYPVAQVQGYELDIEKAQQLLTEAGFPDGEGFPAMNLQIQNRFKDVVVAQEIQKQLSENLNISISISAFNRGTHFERIEEKKVLFWLDSWGADFIEAQNFLSLMLSRNTPEASGSYLNTYRYQNQQFDSLVSAAGDEKNEQTRMKLYAQADNLMMSEAGIMPVYYEKTLLIAKTNIRELDPPIMGRLDLSKTYLKK